MPLTVVVVQTISLAAVCCCKTRGVQTGTCCKMTWYDIMSDYNAVYCMVAVMALEYEQCLKPDT